MTSTSALPKALPSICLTEAERRAFALLETAFGDTLWDGLRAYLEQGTRHSEALQEATACAHWQETVRLGLAIAALAADFDFREVVLAARALCEAVYEGHSAHARRNAAQLLVLEFERSTLVLGSRYPGLVASHEASVA
jgi:hypothetical protein